MVQEVKPSPFNPTPAALGAFFTKIEQFIARAILLSALMLEECITAV